MRNGFLFETFGLIDDEYIAEAATYQKMRQKAVWLRYAGIAAAVLAVAGVIFLVRNTVLKNKSNEEEVPDVTTVLESGKEETVPAVMTGVTSVMTHPDLAEVLFAPDASSGLNVDSLEGAFAGEVLMPYALQQEIGKPENTDKYFAVTLMVSRFECVEQYVAEENEKYEACAKDPALLLFQSEYAHWLNDIYMPQFTQEEQGAIDKKDDLGQISLEEIFIEEYWSKTQTEETQKEYLEAKERLSEVEITYAENTCGKHLVELFGDRIKEDVLTEMNRLYEIGYDIEMVPIPDTYDEVYVVKDGQYGYHVYNGFTVTGYLTGQQLSDFTGVPEHGYLFTWSTKDGNIGIGDA